MRLTNHCKKKITSFALQLDKIDLKDLDASAYSKRYLNHLLDHKLYYLAIYAEVLDAALAKTNKNLSELNLLDFGAGNGLLGMFAKHCGFKKIFLCDVSENFIDASKLTAKIIGIGIDGFITGELGALSEQMPNEKLDIIVGTDVIEHIYDLDIFFAEIKKINPAMVTVFTTASNPDNYLKVRQLKKMQLKDELVGGDPADFALAGEEKHAAYLIIRKQIIQDNFSAIKSDEVENLAKATRGLRRDDIIKFTQLYLTDGKIPIAVSRDSNTCHPDTGSWSERVLPIGYYKELYQRFGFSLTIKNGFYNSFEGGVKKQVNYFMNLLVKIMGKKTAPFITLIGFPQE